MTASARVTLDFPPSVNAMFPTRGARRVPSPAYRAWRDSTEWQIKAQRPGTIPGDVHVRIDLVASDRRRRDCDNLAKAPLDAIVAAGIIEDDSRVRRLSIGWELSGAPCTVTVTSCDRVREVRG